MTNATPLSETVSAQGQVGFINSSPASLAVYKCVCCSLASSTRCVYGITSCTDLSPQFTRTHIFSYELQNKIVTK